MTTVIWEPGKIIVDRKAGCDDHAEEMTKAEIFKNEVIVSIGSLQECTALKAWYKDQTGPHPYLPELNKGNGLLVIMHEFGSCSVVNGPIVVPNETDGSTWGEASGIAIGCIDAGLTLIQAMAVCQRRGSGTGMGADYYYVQDGSFNHHTFTVNQMTAIYDDVMARRASR